MSIKEENEGKESIPVKSHTRKRTPKATREELYGTLPIREIITTVPQ